ncbi:MAG: iron-containing alcohol dehydrogenase [Spirochaetaceae bacterium]|nr:iron-containing alcohol dehydrogenase [Spirochaetaceae bacterium]MCF7939454.1 iron-containing alcohol dehydrogenase [Spirochaetales bacterium]
MKKAFDLSSSSRTVLGNGSVKAVGDILKSNGIKSAAVLMDSGIEKSGIGKKVEDLLTTSGIDVSVVNDLPREPGVPDVNAVLEKVRKIKPDAVVAVGGGSVLDIGKLCSVLTLSNNSILDLFDGAEVPVHSTYTVLIPTTAGTGSEATRNAIIAIPSRNTKGAIVHSRLLPDLVILDPTLTLSLPAGITATTGMDALCHAMECYFSKKANALNDLLAVDAIKRIAHSLRKAVSDGSDIGARSDMLLASYYAGMCITLAGTNAVHAMSYPLGTTYHIPHGQSNAMLLPFVMEYNLKALPEKTKIVAECFGYDSLNSSEEPYQYLINELHTLLVDLDINTSLKSFGVKSEDVESLVNAAHTNRRLMDNNPLDLSKPQIRTVYTRLMEER